MISFKKLSFSILLFLLSAFSANAAVIATYDLNAASGANLPVATSDPAYTWSGFSAVGVSGTAFDNHFYFSGWGSAVDTSKYLSVAVSRAGNYRLGIISFSVESASTGSGAVVVRTSKDSFAANIASFTWTGDQVTDGTLDLSSAGDLSGATELRFYFTATDSSSFGFANHEPPGSGSGSSDVGRDIVFNDAPVGGTAIASVPTLSEWGVILLAILMGFGTFFAMRKRTG